jgi:uncharacterized protein (UPF0332 family)
LKAEQFWRKAVKSLAAARLLLDNGYPDEACSRAYYAMFDAARAALLSVNAPTEAETTRTHSGLMSAFARYVVGPGFVSRDVARTLAQAQHVRLIADYNGDEVRSAEASKVIEWAATFIEALAKLR